MTSASTSPAGKHHNFRRIAPIVACALFMQNLDATVLATALPTMAHEFHVPPTDINLPLACFMNDVPTISAEIAMMR